MIRFEGVAIPQYGSIMDKKDNDFILFYLAWKTTYKANQSLGQDKTRQEPLSVNMENPGPHQKMRIFFLFHQKKNPFGKLFQKQHSKIPAKLRFCET